MNTLTAFERDGTLVVDSRLVAERLNIQHKNFLGTIDKVYQKMAENPRMQAPAFETRLANRPQGGTYQERWAWLTEPQANFLMTLSRNTEEVIDCKMELALAFDQAKKMVERSRSNQQGQPYWYKRLMLYRAKTKIPVGWFSIFEEIIRLVGEIESHGYVLQDGQIPDISVGKCWANYLRGDLINPNDIAMDYKHYYPGWAHSVNANIYPDEYLPMFRKWLEETYKPNKMIAYFKKTSPEALPSICKLLGLPEGK